MASLWKTAKRASWPFVAVIGAAIGLMGLLLTFQDTQALLGFSRVQWLSVGGVVFVVGTLATVLRADYRAHENKRLTPPAEYSQLVSRMQEHHDRVLADTKEQARVKEEGLRLQLETERKSVAKLRGEVEDWHRSNVVQGEKYGARNSELYDQLVSAERTLSEVTKANADIEGVRKELEARCLQVEGERDTWRRNAEMWHHTDAYGTELLYVDPIDGPAYEAMVNRVQELLPKFSAAFEGADQTWREIAVETGKLGSKHPAYWLQDRVTQRERSWAFAANTALREKLRVRHDPRPLLACAYTRYQLWMAWTIRLAGCLGKPLTELDSFRQWQASDAAFKSDFKSCMEISSMKGVKGYVEEAPARDDAGM